MATTKKKAATKGQAKIAKVMREYKGGKLKSSSGDKVTKRKQAVAIALSEARASGAKVADRRPAPKKAATKKTIAKKAATKKAVRKTATKKAAKKAGR